jgi:hypothetical protein
VLAKLMSPIFHHITYIRTINERLSLSSKITYSVASGSFGQRGAFGDAYLIGIQLETKTNTQWSSLVGFKVQVQILK